MRISVNGPLARAISTVENSAESEDWRLVTAASLPPGLSLSRDGRLSGTPLTVGTYVFAIQLGASTLSTFDIEDVAGPCR